MATPSPPKSEHEKGEYNDAQYSHARDAHDAPPPFEANTVLEAEDASIINYKTLSWWYVHEPHNDPPCRYANWPIGKAASS